MNITPTPLKDVFILEPVVLEDERGYFFESWNERTFSEIADARFVQDNQSGSVRGVLRGLHYQLPPAAQGKLVRVISGSVFDVAVDIRRSSPTFRHWFAQELSSANRLQLWVPPGFAHGFLVLSNSAEIAYKTTGFYSRDHDRALAWDDPEIAIDWPTGIDGPILSAKDQAAPRLAVAEVFD